MQQLAGSGLFVSVLMLDQKIMYSTLGLGWGDPGTQENVMAPKILKFWKFSWL